MKRVVLVGGGTAGHVEPALAVGKWIKEHDSEVELGFIGTKSGVEVELLINTGITFHPILKVPFPRQLNLNTLMWPLKFKYSFLQALLAIRKADLVIGFGGYVSAPTYLAAKTMRIPIIIHEANALPGLANRLGSKLTNNIFVAFDAAKKFNRSWRNAINCGMPIKEQIDNFNTQNIGEMKNRFLTSLNLDLTKKTLLIFGGSVGARQINQSVLDARGVLLAQDWNVIHAVGHQNELPISERNYRAVPYISDMAAAYAAADFVICRSGAVTCAELAATGIPALLVPLEIGNGEQEANASELIETGQAKKVNNRDFTGEWLKANIGITLKGVGIKRQGVSRHSAAVIGSRALEILDGAVR